MTRGKVPGDAGEVTLCVLSDTPPRGRAAAHVAKWPEVNLGEVASIQRTTVDPATVSSDTFYIGLENIERGGKIVKVVTVGEVNLGSLKYRFSKEHVLFGKLRPYLAKISRPDFDGICSTDILPIVPGSRLDRGYLAYFLSQPSVVDLASSKATGVNLPRLSPAELAKFRLPLPRLDEQQQIAALLDLVAALRAKRRKAVALLDDLARSVFFDMFGAPNEEESLWPIKSVGEICSLMIDCVNRTAPVVDYETPYKMIRTTNVKFGKVDLSSARYVAEEIFYRWNRRATPRKGDVVFTREAPVGEAGIIDSTDRVFLGQRLMLYRVDPEIATPEYLLATFQSPFLRRQFDRHGSGTTVKHLPLPACRSFRIPSPPLALQQMFTERIKALEALRSDHTSHLLELDALFAAIQHRAFRGELSTALAG